MAGIGFELQRVLKRGGIGSFVKVALSGIMIVAGPWLLSIIGIFLIGRFAGVALREGRSLFMSVVIYSYAFSLFFFPISTAKLLSTYNLFIEAANSSIFPG